MLAHIYMYSNLKLGLWTKQSGFDPNNYTVSFLLLLDLFTSTNFIISGSTVSFVLFKLIQFLYSFYPFCHCYNNLGTGLLNQWQLILFVNKACSVLILAISYGCINLLVFSPKCDELAFSSAVHSSEWTSVFNFPYLSILISFFIVHSPTVQKSYPFSILQGFFQVISFAQQILLILLSQICFQSGSFNVCLSYF